MAVTIKEMERRLSKAIKSLDNDVLAITRRIEDQIIDLNREDQLFEKGIDTTGSLIGVYSKATEGITKGKSGRGFPKRAGSPYNFYDTGEMFKSFRLKKGKGTISLFNSSQSLREFSKRTGIDESRLIGLTDENTRKLNFELIRPRLIEFVRKHLAGK